MIMEDIPGIRKRVKIPGIDNVQDVDFYEDGPKGHDPLNKTALREAERKFKSKKSQLEFPEVYERFKDKTPVMRCKFHLFGEEIETDGYELQDKEGFLYFPGAVPLRLQERFVKNILEGYLIENNESNLDPFYVIPKGGLFKNLDQLVVSKKDNKSDLLGSVLMKKLRWVTLGYRYNWTTKEYDFEKGFEPIGQDLQLLCSSFAASLGFDNYQAEAGIVNFYQPDDSLTCHVDRSEKNMQSPLISISFGLDAIFLLGGEGRDDTVDAIRVRSGDILILGGKSRKYFHGVPKVFESSVFAGSDPKINEFMQTTRINLNIRQVF
jgi:alkylated DNA repair protein alkB homolog 1